RRERDVHGVRRHLHPTGIRLVHHECGDRGRCEGHRARHRCPGRGRVGPRHVRLASARRLVRALSDGDDGARGPASAVAVRTIPLAAGIGRSPRGSRYITPVLEVAASLPATALLPIIVGFALIVTASLGPAAELSAILIALFSMQWYLLFNLIAGVRGIPEDLEE